MNLRLPASRPGSKFPRLDLSSRRPGSKFRPSAGKFWHHEVAAFSSKTLTTAMPLAPAAPHHQASQYQDPKQRQKERVSKGKGGGHRKSSESLKMTRNSKGIQQFRAPRRNCVFRATTVTRLGQTYPWNFLSCGEVPPCLMSGNGRFRISGSRRAGMDQSSARWI